MSATMKAHLMARDRAELLEHARELNDVQEEFMHALVQARENVEMKQREVAELLGVSQASISQFENYDNDPKLSTVRRYALAIGAKLELRVREASDWSRLSYRGHVPESGAVSESQQTSEISTLRFHATMASIS